MTDKAYSSLKPPKAAANNVTKPASPEAKRYLKSSHQQQPERLINLSFAPELTADLDGLQRKLDKLMVSEDKPIKGYYL